MSVQVVESKSARHIQSGHWFKSQSEDLCCMSSPLTFLVSFYCKVSCAWKKNDLRTVFVPKWCTSSLEI